MAVSLGLEAERLVERLLEAWNAHDAPAFGDCFTNESDGGGERVLGRDARQADRWRIATLQNHEAEH